MNSFETNTLPRPSSFPEPLPKEYFGMQEVPARASRFSNSSTESATQDIFTRTINYLRGCFSSFKSVCNYFYAYPSALFTYIPNSIYIFFYGDGMGPRSCSLHTDDLCDAFEVNRLSQIRHSSFEETLMAKEIEEMKDLYGPNIDFPLPKEDLFAPAGVALRQDIQVLPSSPPLHEEADRDS